MLRALAFALCCGFAAPAAAQQNAPFSSLVERVAGPPDSAETLAYIPDAEHRMTVSVNIAGRGPFRFIVDTGAERTVISSELASALDLDDGGDVMLASVTRVARVPSVVIPELEVGRRTLSPIRAPALAERHLGAQGMLGVDSLRSQRVVFDFTRQELTLSAAEAASESAAPGEIVVRGRSRLGRLVITRASVNGQRTMVIIDTGSQVTIGNGALRARLERRGHLGPTQPLALTGVTGDRVTAEYTVARNVQLGGVSVIDLPVAFSDVHLFRYLGLVDRPAILLGMDALRAFDRVSIDFASRRVRLRPPSSGLEPPVRLAAGDAPAR